MLTHTQAAQPVWVVPLLGVLLVCTLFLDSSLECGMEQNLGPSAEKIWKETLDKDSEAAAARKSTKGGDRGWRKGLHSVQTFLNLIISD